MLPRSLAAAAREAGVPADDAPAAAAWLLSPAAGRLPAARAYLFYLKWMYETFHAVAELFPPGEPDRAGRLDAAAMATSPEEMLHLANHLYLLDRGGIAGAVLECGCFKGFSTACLSHACAALGRRLHVADSFAGLPAPGPDEGAYAPGDFRGTRAEVEANVRALGRPDQIEYHAGWFSESLPGWREPLALLWIDVDLYRSAEDALAAVLPALDPRGAVFTHELLPEHVREGAIVHRGEPSGALADALSARGLAHRAAHAAGWTGVATLEGSPAMGGERLLSELLPFLRDSDHRSRAARQALGLRNAVKDLGRRARSAILGRPSKDPR